MTTLYFYLFIHLLYYHFLPCYFTYSFNFLALKVDQKSEIITYKTGAKYFAIRHITDYNTPVQKNLMQKIMTFLKIFSA